MNKFFKNIIRKNQVDELFSHQITQKTLKVFLIHCLGIILVLISNFWIARLLNTSGYGQFSYIITVINFLSTFACLGFSSSLVRDIAFYLSKNKFGEVKGLMRVSYIIGTISAIILLSSLILASYFRLLPIKVDMFTLINIAISILVATLLLLRQFALQGMNHTTISQVVNSLVRYFIIIMLLVVFLQISPITITIDQVILINTISLVISLVLIELLLKQAIPKQVITSQPVYHTQLWLRTAFVLLAYRLMINYLASSEILLLGVMRENEEVGIYSIARKIAGFVSFGLFAANIVLAPKIASLYAEGKLALLQALIHKSIRLIFIFSLVVTAGLAIIAYPVFEFLGEEYTNSYKPLLIMMAGELANVAFGPVAVLLISSNQEKLANKIMLITVILNLISNIILIHYFGYIGAAITSALSVIIWNSLMAVAVNKKIGIKSWI